MWKQVVNSIESYLKGDTNLAGINIGQAYDPKTDKVPAIRIMYLGEKTEGGKRLNADNSLGQKTSVNLIVWMFAKNNKPDPTPEEGYAAIYDLENKVEANLVKWTRLDHAGELAGYLIKTTIKDRRINEHDHRPTIGSYFEIEVTCKKVL